MRDSGGEGGNRQRSQAALALLLAGSLAAGHVAAQEANTVVSPEMAAQKARMLEAFFSSKRLRQAVERNPEAASPLESEAQAKLEAGRAALETGQYAEATALFDDGMRAVTQAVALGAAGSDWDEAAASTAFVARRRHTDSYLSALERSDDISGTERARIADLRVRLGEADGAFAAGEVRTAGETLDQVYRDVVGLVSEIRRGHTVMVSRVFETVEEEFDYERQRYHSYFLLVQIALAERSEDQPGFAALAARLSAQSRRLLDQAERERSEGEVGNAIDTMENATERLLVVLRASGLIMME